MSLVFEKQIGVLATHAILIGVGAYTHLLGGDGDLFKGHESMGQLTSPSHSAQYWLKHNRNMTCAHRSHLLIDQN